MNPIGSVDHAVVLAGGRSTRMGQSKALLTLGQETLVERLIRGLGGVFGSVALSTAELDESLAALPGVSRCYADQRPDRGPLEGVRSSLQAMTADHAFFVAVDSPVIWEPLVRVLVRHALDAGRGAVPRIDGRFEPGFAVYGRALLEDIEAAVENGERRLQALAGRPGVAVVDLDAPGVLEEVVAASESRSMPRELFWSVNTPEDYDRLVEAFTAGAVAADPIIF
jgi:molybdopterin-guanine dinucleotide biosynthesis protein A